MQVREGETPISNPLRRRTLGALMSLVALPLVGCGGGDNEQQLVPAMSEDGHDDAGNALLSDASAMWAARTYSARWAHTLVPEMGQVPVWTVGTGTGIPTVQDCWGLLRHARLGEARFWGARRVENKMRCSADLTNATYWSSVGTAVVQLLSTDSWASDSTGAFRAHRLSKTSTNSARLQSVGVLPAVPHTFSVHARSESLTQVHIQIYVSGGPVLASGVFNIGASGWTRVQVSGTPDGISSYRVLISPGPFVSATPGSILVCDVQLEDVSGHPNAAASEYVATDRPNPPSWHYGAMVDGVRYFDTYKGNTVAGGTVTAGAGEPIPTTILRHLRLDPQAVNLCTQSESFSSWTNESAVVVLTPNAALSPRGDRTATRMTDTPATTSKFISHALGTLAAGAPITVSCFAKAEAARWLRLNVTLSDGNTVFGFFDVQAGQLGALLQASGRPCWAHIEPWGNGWYRCVLTVQNSLSGAAAPLVRVGIAPADNTISYAGTGGSLLVWGAHAAPVEYAPSYIPNLTSTSGVTRQSQSIEVPNAGGNVMGQQNYVVALDVFPTYYTGVTIKGGLVPAWRTLWYAFASGAYQQQHRLGLGLRPNTVSFFGDRYLGDPNTLYYWRPNTHYPVGAIVIPTDTLLNNGNLRKMFICVVAGTSGQVEPTWNTAFVSRPDTTTAVTVDGSVRWQNNHDNNFQGQWEPYDTSVLDAGYSMYPTRMVGIGGATTDVIASPVMRSSYFSAPGVYGYAINGTNAKLKTLPFPIDGSSGGDLHQPMESLRFGRLNEPATAHPMLVGNVIVSRETLDAETNRLRSEPGAAAA